MKRNKNSSKGSSKTLKSQIPTLKSQLNATFLYQMMSVSLKTLLTVYCYLNIRNTYTSLQHPSNLLNNPSCRVLNRFWRPKISWRIKMSRWTLTCLKTANMLLFSNVSVALYLWKLHNSNQRLKNSKVMLKGSEKSANKSNQKLSTSPSLNSLEMKFNQRYKSYRLKLMLSSNRLLSMILKSNRNSLTSMKLTQKLKLLKHILSPSKRP